MFHLSGISVSDLNLVPEGKSVIFYPAGHIQLPDRSVIMGFGMLFQGITLMKDAIAPLSESEGFINFLSTLDNPALAVIFGIAFTALLQSSSSSTVIFQAFAVQGLLNYNVAVYLVIGAAIGSVTPNILASLTANRNGKRAAIDPYEFSTAGIFFVFVSEYELLRNSQKTLCFPAHCEQADCRS